MKIIYDAKWRKPGKTIGEIIKDDITYDHNYCENELIVEIGEKIYKGMRVLMLREIGENHENQKTRNDV